MEIPKRLIHLTFLMNLIGHLNGQNIGASGQQIVGQLGQAINTLKSDPTRIQQLLGMLQNPGRAIANNAQLASQMTQLYMTLSKSVDRNCLQDMGTFVQALSGGQQWALKMIDAIGKPPAGLLNYKLTWIGDWDECVTTKAAIYSNNTGTVTVSNPFVGKYCAVSVGLPVSGMFGQKVSLNLGTCFPDSCSSADVKAMLTAVVGFLPTTTKIPAPDVSCKEHKLPLDTQAMVVIFVCAIFAAVMTLATIYDVIYVNWLVKQKARSSTPQQNGVSLQVNHHTTDIYIVQTEPMKEKETDFNALSEKPDVVDPPCPSAPPAEIKYEPSILEKILLSFSVYTNGTKLLNTNQPKGALTAVNGIRFISMSWVIVGHTYAWLGSIPTDNFIQYAMVMLKRWEFTPILNGTFSVDTFFLLSGLLVSYLSLKELKKVKGPKNFKWGMYYFHRVWRLTPPYMLLLMLWVSLDKYVGNGPIWPQEKGFEREACRKDWWKNLLYINNVAPNNLYCFGWSWYLANDMQFYIISPLILIALFYSRILGGLACLGLLVGSAVSSGVISMYYELPPSNAIDQTHGDAYMRYYYVKPWCRVGPYAVGLFTGYLLYRSKLQMKINRFVNVALWIVAAVIGCLIIYGIHTPEFKNPFTLKQSALYNATARSAWGACVAWVIVACANGYGGPINRILSWSGFVPLGRLTYCAYLVHPMLLGIHKMSQLTTITVYDYNIVYIILGHMCMSYAAAFVISMAFEAPMMGLEKAIFGRGKSS